VQKSELCLVERRTADVFMRLTPASPQNVERGDLVIGTGKTYPPSSDQWEVVNTLPTAGILIQLIVAKI